MNGSQHAPGFQEELSGAGLLVQALMDTSGWKTQCSLLEYILLSSQDAHCLRKRIFPFCSEPLETLLQQGT